MQECEDRACGFKFLPEGACILRHVRLCDAMIYSLQVSSVHGILQARTLEWVAISSCRESSRPKQGLNPRILHLLHGQMDSLVLSHLGSLYASV